MGTRRGGMATFDGKTIHRSIHNLENAYFRSKFSGKIGKFSGNSGIGIISDTDSQPVLFNTRLGKYAVVTVAKINNKDKLHKDLLKTGFYFSDISASGTNPTEIISILISQGSDFVEGIENVYKKVKGSCSMLILTEKGIIAARDFYGRTPVIIGKGEQGYAVSGETNSFANLGFEVDYTLGPGEIVLITADGCRQLRKPEEKSQVCSFLWIYYGYPASEYEKINVETVRRKLGIEMAKKDDIDADYVSGIPDSGVGMALGYSEGRKIAYRRAIVKYTATWPRSFMPAGQETRDLIAKMKLIPNRHLLENKRIIFCDDSLVRGTQLKDNSRVLYQYGAKEVHVRLSCPPLVYACPFINFSASKSEMELITRRTIKKLEGDQHKNLEEYVVFGSRKYNEMVDYICNKLGITSLKFNSIDGLVNAIGLPKQKICTHCFDNSSYGHQ
jgi:amidophosphoribosyltransferase